MSLVMTRLAIAIALVVILPAGMGACGVPFVLRLIVAWNLGWVGAAWAFQGVRRG